jgi:Concanavalin A-like lectin/glucanases superfamily
MRIVVMVAAIVGVLSLFAADAHADRFTSTNYAIDPSVGNGFGGGTTGTNYKMTSSGGEAIIGNGAGGSYILGQGYVSQIQKSLELQSVPKNAIGYFSLDEGTGVAAYDDSTNNNHLSLANGATWTTGKIGNALNFDGANDYAEVTSGGSAPTSYDAIVGSKRTISAWFKASAPASTRTFLWKEGSCLGWSFTLSATGVVTFKLGTGNSGCTGTVNKTMASGTGFANNAWHHVAAVIDRPAGSITLFVDGSQVATDATVSTTLGASGGAFRIGTDGTNATPFPGQVDNVFVYDKALTAKQVTAAYTTENAGVPYAVSFDALTPGTPQTIASQIIVETDAPGYSLSIAQDHDLQSGANFISAMAGTSIAVPGAWTDGTTKGLGFTLSAGVSLDPKWGSNPNYNYAPIPGSATTFYSRSGFSGGTKDTLDVQYKLDATNAQVAGDYTNTVTYVGTMTP